MKGATYSQVLEERNMILKRDYDKLCKFYYKQRRFFVIAYFGSLLVYAVIIAIILNN